MKSPFVDFQETEIEHNKGDEMFGELGLASPFLASEKPNAFDQQNPLEGEDMVDEEESQGYEYEINYENGIEDFFEGEDNTQVEPLPVPEKSPVPFAPTPPTGSFWPVITNHIKGREVAYQGIDKKFKGNSGRRFLAGRTDGVRYHVGIDLWANDNDPIVACEDGKIVNFYHFYRSTYALLVEHKDVVVNYGEVHKDSLKLNNLKVGDYVKAGQVIGKAGKMYHSSMLHFETYVKGTLSNKRFKVGGAPPKEVLNPTKYLLFLKQHGLEGQSTSQPKSNTTGPSGTTNKDWSKAVELNQYYMTKLNWIQHIYTINELLLKATGQANMSLGEEAFAEAVAAWQRQNGFSQKDSDGIIGPNTWKKMQSALGLNSELSSNHDSVTISIDKGTVSRILGYTDIIEKYSKLHKINLNIIRGIIAAESAGNALTGKGTSGYKGLMQAEPTEDQLQPEVSVRSGIEKFIKFKEKILNPWLTKQGIATPASTDENYLKASLACYNAGHVTVLKAIQYAQSSGDWRKWLSPDIYKRALAFSGGYAFYKPCSKNAGVKEIDVAKKERLKYRFKSNWKTDPDPAPWATVALIMNPITRCWIETKYKNTPGYLSRFIQYFKYFDTNPAANELEMRTNEYQDPSEQFWMSNEDAGALDENDVITAEEDAEWLQHGEMEAGFEHQAVELEEEQFVEENTEFDDAEEPDYEFYADEPDLENQKPDDGWLESETINGNEEIQSKYDLEYTESESPDDFESSLLFSGESGDGKATLVSVPPLIAEDSSMPGHTTYVEIGSGKGNYPLSMTGIYVPAAFDPRQPVDAILYLHGITSNFPGAYAQTIDYWRAAKLPNYDLRIREDINGSGKNVVLVAPSLGDNPYKYRNDLSSKNGGLDDYFTKVLAAINAYTIKKRFNAGPVTIRNLILAAHSAGGWQMLKIAMLNNPIYGARISECWGFDCLYGKVVDAWRTWASKNSNKKLMVYYQGTTAGNSTLLARNSTKLPNVFIKKSPAKNHYWVVRHHLKERLARMGNANLSKLDFEIETEYDFEGITSTQEREWSKAVVLNRRYSEELGWTHFHDQINDLLLPFSGLENVSLGEEAFAKALARWQQQEGFSKKDCDGVLGPMTWKRMQPFIGENKIPTGVNLPGSDLAQAEWSASQTLQNFYANWQSYNAKRSDVMGWGITSPATYIESAIREWQANPSMHSHFDRNFDGDPKRCYLNLRRLYQKKNISDPASYFTSNIVPIKFFNRSTVGHRDLANALNKAQSELISAGYNFTLSSAWSFVPRTVNYNINMLSNHALGTAVDINPSSNPHIMSKGEIEVINAVCRPVLTSGLLAETDPDILRKASDHFRSTFNDEWINQQTLSTLIKAIKSNRTRLNQFATNGFMNLPTVFIRALQNAALGWGGSWKSSKDFMHFELRHF